MVPVFWWWIERVIFRWFVLFFSFIDNNDIKILPKSSWLLLLHLWWIQNCRQKKIYHRLCMKRVLYIFWNNSRRPRQTMGSWCCLQDMCRTFKTMYKWNQTVNGIWYTNSLEGAYKHVDDCYFCSINVTGINKKKRLSLSYKSFPSVIRPYFYSWV